MLRPSYSELGRSLICRTHRMISIWTCSAAKLSKLTSTPSRLPRSPMHQLGRTTMISTLTRPAPSSTSVWGNIASKNISKHTINPVLSVPWLIKLRYLLGISVTSTWWIHVPFVRSVNLWWKSIPWEAWVTVTTASSQSTVPSSIFIQRSPYCRRNITKELRHLRVSRIKRNCWYTRSRFNRWSVGKVDEDQEWRERIAVHSSPQFSTSLERPG